MKRCIGSTTEARRRRVMSETPSSDIGIGAVDRHHHDIEPADRRELAVVELMVQVPEMADAEAGDLEDEDRVAVLDHLAATIVAEIAADVGGHVADEDVADALRLYSHRSPFSPQPCRT